MNLRDIILGRPYESFFGQPSRILFYFFVMRGMVKSKGHLNRAFFNDAIPPLANLTSVFDKAQFINSLTFLNLV